VRDYCKTKGWGKLSKQDWTRPALAVAQRYRIARRRHLDAFVSAPPLWPAAECFAVYDCCVSR